MKLTIFRYQRLFSTDPKVQWRPQAESGTLDDLMPTARSGILRGGDTKTTLFLSLSHFSSVSLRYKLLVGNYRNSHMFPHLYGNYMPLLKVDQSVVTAA